MKRKIWNAQTQQSQDIPDHVENFLKELEELCKKHNLSINHEDDHGSFIVQQYEEENIQRVNKAYMDIYENKPAE